MKTRLLLAILPIFVLALATSVQANHFREFYANANCAGWEAWGSVYVVKDGTVDLYYDVELKEGAVVIASFSGMVTLTEFDNAFSFSELWGMELCGSYVAEGLFYFTSPYGDDQRSFSIPPFVCECDTTYGCAGTPGYWKNRPEEWPVSSLMIGGVSYSLVQLLDIFDMPTRGRITVKLAHHLIAAKLNVLIGADDYIQGAIDDADAYLMDHAIGTRPHGADKDEGVALKDALKDYNESTCPEDYMDGLIPSLMQSGGQSIQNSGTETKSWGDIKKLNK